MHTASETPELAASGAEHPGSARESRSARAYRELAPERATLEQWEILAVNRDVGRVVVKVLGAIPGLRKMRPAIVEALPRFDVGRFDRLESYALALAHAQAEYLKAPAINPGPRELAKEARRWRDELLMAVQCLVARGLVPKPSARILECRRAYGPLALAVLALAQLLEQHWPAICGRTALELSELDQASEAARRLLDAMALPRRRPEKRAAAEQRSRAFALLVRAYADARRAVRFVRWHDRDADGAAASLYGRGGRRRSRASVGRRAIQKRITSQATRVSSDREHLQVSAIGPSAASNPQNRRPPMSTTQTRRENNDSSSSSFRDAYESALSEIQSVPDSELVHISIDLTSAAVTALGALPEIRALREEIAENLPKFDRVRFDQLETYTRALIHAQALYRSATTPSESLADLAAELTSTRDVFFSDASALARRGLISPERLKEFKASNGYREIAIDVLGLAALLREHWSCINGKTAATLADLDEAASSVEHMLVALGLREQAPSAIADVVKNRQRAFTLFVRTYDDARRAVAYLRPEEVDDIAPSLYAGRAARRKSSEDATAQAPAGAAA
ncbi:MAG: hypothetical protein JW940_13600, partial [Polyangiaceae bacterium]|nr:hypothetical protein [Polyangiaceae bacterium]